MSRPTPLGAAAATELAWGDAIDQILAEPELVRPVFQPIVDLERGVATGYEMLARFRSPLKAAPPEWFAAADRLGVGARLEALLVNAGLDALEELPENCFLTINVSPGMLPTDEVMSALARPSSLERVVIEVTEQTEVEDYDALEHVLHSLRAAGAAIAVDDAGAGYASLSHIVALRPQFVKLDRGLVADLDHEEAKLAVIESLGTFASRIDAWLVAEGVERREEVAALQRLRVPLAQGYGLGMPAPAMAPIDAEESERIRSAHPGTRLETGLAALVEPVQGAPLAAGGEAIAEAFGAHQSLEYVAVLDARRRPVSLVPRQGFFGGGGRERQPMRVELGEDVVTVARRAMTRPFGERFDPVVCCDGRGRYIGLVKVERLVEGLTALVQPEGKEATR
jgi:EAL domain-containing protein (putative c-di-GMP-specific phosphodiesterase class I)